MGTFHIFVKDLLASGCSITIHCFCLRTAVWTQDQLSRFAPTKRLWNATEHFRCETCGRLGKVRDIDVHGCADEGPAPPQRERVRKAIPLRGPAPTAKRRTPKKGRH